MSIRYKGIAEVVGGEIMATPPAGSSALYDVCFVVLALVVLLLVPLAVVPVAVLLVALLPSVDVDLELPVSAGASELAVFEGDAVLEA